MTRIALFNSGFYSHGAAATRVGVTLSRLGYEVNAWGPEQFRDLVESHGGRLHPHEPKFEQEFRGPVDLAFNLAQITERHADELIEQVHQQQVDLIVHDAMMPWARVAADFLGLPRIAIQPMLPVAPNPPADADAEAPVPDVDEAEERLAAMRLSIARKWHVELGNWQQLIYSWGEATFVLTTQRITGRRSLPREWHYVGPLIDLPSAQATERGQAATRPLVYACFGTSFNRRRDLFAAVAEAAADEPVDLLISTGRSSEVTTSDLGPLPSNVVVRDFVPALEILSRARLHITHGGCNSVHESLLAGVPMLCIPQAVDQFPMAERIERLGVGETVEDNAEAIRKAVRRLIEDRRPRKRARELGRHLACYEGGPQMARVVERVLSA